MGDIEWNEVEAIIDTVLDLPKNERLAYIEKRCGQNPRLKGEVTQLLDSISNSDGWLENPRDYKLQLYEELSDDLESIGISHSLIGEQVGSYIIKEQIGEGGMGIVYLAERSGETFEHKVAIKVLRQTHATDTNIERFKREQRILAGLNHPGIAKLFDGGITQEGSPYIIMEYISGTPIDKYCRQNNCSINKKIHLFKQVLEAVRYAHENLVIHRDLKPANILIDDTGNVKILDFGISKFLQEDEELNITHTGSRLLTPKYAAPEQITQTNITTATDLYSLGVVFYELLTGLAPYDFEEASRYEIEQTILKQRSSAPSKRVNTRQLQQNLRGDLDAIALKAIRKEPNKRYRLANEFIKDLDNYLQDLPVSARRDSFKYRTKKFLNRNKQSLSLAAVFLLLIIGFTSFYTWRITAERNQAQFEAQRAEEITDFLVSILELSNPSENSGNEITINDALHRGIQYLEEQNISALNKATILGTIGSIQINNGDIDKAGLSLERAMSYVTDSLDQQTTKTLNIGTEYAEWQKMVGNMEKADQYFRFTDSLYQVNKLQNSISYLKNQLTYSDFLMEISQYEKALNLLSNLDNHFRNFSRDNKSTVDLLADLYNNRGRAFKNMGENEKALQNLKQALKLKQEIYNQNNPKIARIYHNMGVVYGTMAEFSKAMEMAQKAYQIRLNVYKPTHQLVGSTLHLLGNTAMELGKYDQAYNYIEQSLAITKKQHGAHHFRYALGLREYAKILNTTGQFDSALKQIEKATKIITENYGSKHPYYGYMMHTYAEIFFRSGKNQKAMDYGDIAIKNFSQNFGDQHPNLGRAYANQGKYALNRNQFNLADSLLTTSVEIMKQHFDKDNTYLKKADSLLQVVKSKNAK